jgi:2'-5' RNA ligase
MRHAFAPKRAMRVAAPKGATTLRVFFALWPDADARDRLATLAQDVAARTNGRAPPPANLHVTLAFVGEVSAERIEALRAIGASVATGVSPFVLTLDCAGTFRGTGVAWAGTSSLPPPLAQLGRDLTDALAAQGFAIERRAFSPHLTLARRCKSPGLASLAAPVGWTVTRLALDASEPGSGAPRYRELASWPLGVPL